MDEKIKVLVVDDTIVYRQILSSVVSGMKDVDLLGAAPNGKIALSKIKLSPPDVVLLDVSMPVMDGLEALTHIRTDFPDIDVIMVSGADMGNANLTMKALNLGALDFVPKPQGISTEENFNSLRTALTPLMSLVKTRKYSRQLKKITSSERAVIPPIEKEILPVQEPKAISEPVVVPVPRIQQKIGRIDVIGIGVSTGGPNALQQIIPLISGDMKVPIIAVQHMPPMFTASLAERLKKDSYISVLEGAEGMRVEEGKMYIAPGGHHMVVRKTGPKNYELGIVDTPPVNSCRPAVDVLFRSMAMVYDGNILTVILTGMGNDGAAGVRAIRRKGGYSIVQDEATSVVWGMPQAVVSAMDADEIIPLNRIAKRIMEIVN